MNISQAKLINLVDFLETGRTQGSKAEGTYLLVQLPNP